MFNSPFYVVPLGGFHVAEMARRAKVTPATIRYYAQAGLLNPERDPGNGYRCFSAADLRCVVFISQAKALGLTIADIKSILESLKKGAISCHQVRSLVEQRLISVRERIAEFRATEVRITHAKEVWAKMNDPIPRDDELCPLIERLVRVADAACQASETGS